MRYSFIIIAIISIIYVDGAAAGDSDNTTNFMGNDPTAEQLIDALKTPRQKYKFRSIAVVKDEPKTKVLLRIPFEFNSAELTPEARKTLKTLGTALGSSELLGNSFEVVGHTDGKGSASYNQDLSTRRALAVKRYLYSSENVDDDRLLPIGKGESELLDSDNPQSPANRRVEIINIGQ